MWRDNIQSHSKACCRELRAEMGPLEELKKKKNSTLPGAVYKCEESSEFTL